MSALLFGVFCTIQLFWNTECNKHLNNSGNDSSAPETVQTLRFVFGVYRHGFRGPIYDPYPSDPYQDLNKYFPEGKGGLTKKGKWQLYRLGQALRQNYDHFLDELYSTDKFYFVSTDVERTILSAELLAAGIFPPVSFQKWSDCIDWQPIPIWRDNNKVDKTIESNGLELPQWTKNIFPEKMKPTVADLFSAVVSGTQKMLQITAGGLMTEIQHHFSAKANQTLWPDRKLYLLGGHDVTVIALLHSIGIKQSIIIKPADMVLLELHENETFHSVRVLYAETVNITTLMHELMIPGCESPCDLQTFMNITTETYTLMDWDLLCQS